MSVRERRASTRVGVLLMRPFDLGDGGWTILYGPEVRFGAAPDIVVPDWAGWRRERMPRLPLDATFFTLVPNWICEVLSASTKAIDRSDKMDVYAREGVQHVWFIDPTDKLLEAYRLDGGRWLRIGAWRGDVVARIEPFDAIELAVSRLWED